MALEFEHKPGQTPLDPDEVAGLRPKHIATQGDLDEWETDNILAALKWLNKKLKKEKTPFVLDDQFCRELHKRMFNQTWTWAGKYRLSDKNIGCDYRQIGTKLRDLMEDVSYWLDHKTFPMVEIAVRFHHRLVLIHPFPNGNGRHARMMTDALLVERGFERFSWGAANLSTEGEVRRRYIQALRDADAGDLSALIDFVQ